MPLNNRDSIKTEGNQGGVMKEKLALFLPHLKGGGAEKIMINLAEGFLKRELSVDLLLARAEGDYLNLVPKDVRVIDFDSMHIALSFPKFLRYLKTERCNTVLAVFGSDVLSLVAKKIFKKNLRVFIRLERMISTDFSPRYGLLWRTSFRILKHLLPSADGIISLSHETTEDLKRVVPKASSLIRNIYNPVVTPEIIKKSCDSPSHPWISKKDNIPIVLSVGRLVVDKDHMTLLRAFNRIVKKFPAHLILLGQGPLEKQLKDYVRISKLTEFVDFAGFKMNPYAFMANANVTVLSSVNEGLPNVLIESMACGTPVVSTDCASGPREILRDGIHGQLVPIRDDKALADAIIQTLEHPPQKNILKKRAMDFSVDACIEDYMQFLGYNMNS